MPCSIVLFQSGPKKMAPAPSVPMQYADEKLWPTLDSEKGDENEENLGDNHRNAQAVAPAVALKANKNNATTSAVMAESAKKKGIFILQYHARFRQLSYVSTSFGCCRKKG